MKMTEVFDGIGRPCVGYAINTGFSADNTRQLTSLMQVIKHQFGDGVYTPPEHALHITLMDWIAPMTDYAERDEDRLFDELYPSYDQTLTASLLPEQPIDVRFTEIRVTPTTIIIVGQDDGAFGRIRDSFVDSVELLPDAKQPPTIIHSSLARFTSSMPVVEVERFIAEQNIDFVQRIDSFRLMRQTKQLLLEAEILKQYPLTPSS